MYVEGNRLSDLPGDVFQNLILLQEVFLSSNRLKYLPKDVFRNLRSLTALHIQRNRLEHLPKDVFPDLISLQILDLSYNEPLQGLADNIFGYLKNLKALGINGIQFTSLPEEIFQGPINLIYLYLDSTVRVDLDCEGLCSLKTRPSSNLCFGKSILDYCSLPYCFPSNYSNHPALEATGSGVGRKYNNVTQYRVSWSCPAGDYATNRFTYCSQTNSTLTGAIDCKALNCSDDVPAKANIQEDELRSFIVQRAASTSVELSIYNCRIFPKVDSSTARIVVNDKCGSLLKRRDFWPRPIYCRPWNFEKYATTSSDSEQGSNNAGEDEHGTAGNDNQETSAQTDESTARRVQTRSQQK